MPGRHRPVHLPAFATGQRMVLRNRTKLSGSPGQHSRAKWGRLRSLWSPRIMNPSVLIDWLGAGGIPVDSALAENRAQTCISGFGGKPCPRNRSPKWWEFAKEPIAQAILGTLEAKTTMNLRVSSEDNLHMCDVCGCCLPLKVWVPIHHVVQHSTAAELAEFPDHCWIKKETETSHIP